MNATGLRDQRLRLYDRVEQGTDGYTEASFLFNAERWGRLDERSATVQQMQQRLQLKLDAVAEFADEVTIPLSGLLVDTTDGRAWWVRGVNKMRLLRRVIVGLERIADEQFRMLRKYDDDSQLGGAHVVNPA